MVSAVILLFVSFKRKSSLCYLILQWIIDYLSNLFVGFVETTHPMFLAESYSMFSARRWRSGNRERSFMSQVSRKFVSQRVEWLMDVQLLNVAQKKPFARDWIRTSNTSYLFAIVSELVSESALPIMIHITYINTWIYIYILYIYIILCIIYIYISYSFQCQISRTFKNCWAHECSISLAPPQSSKPLKSWQFRKSVRQQMATETGFVKRIGLLNRKKMLICDGPRQFGASFLICRNSPQKDVTVCCNYSH